MAEDKLVASGGMAAPFDPEPFKRLRAALDELSPEDRSILRVSMMTGIDPRVVRSLTEGPIKRSVIEYVRVQEEPTPPSALK